MKALGGMLVTAIIVCLIHIALRVFETIALAGVDDLTHIKLWLSSALAIIGLLYWLVQRRERAMGAM